MRELADRRDVSNTAGLGTLDRGSNFPGSLLKKRDLITRVGTRNDVDLFIANHHIGVGARLIATHLCQLIRIQILAILQAALVGRSDRDVARRILIEQNLLEYQARLKYWGVNSYECDFSESIGPLVRTEVGGQIFYSSRRFNSTHLTF